MLYVHEHKNSPNEAGSISGLLVALILVLLLLVGSLAFGYWAFTGRQNYKNNADQMVQAAVTAAKQQQAQLDANHYAQVAKDPLRTYVGPSAYGSIHVSYPRTWSGYVAVATAQSGSSNPVDGYFDPNVVPDINDPTSIYALRVKISQNPYNQILQSYQSQVQQGLVTVKPYALPKVPSVVGVRLDGQIAQNIQGSMIILPLRDTTLQIWTESQSYEADFNNSILPNFSFSP